MGMIERPDASQILPELQQGVSLTITYYPLSKKVTLEGPAMQDRDVMYVLLGHGSNEALDYVHAESYWEIKQVEVNLENLLGELGITKEPVGVSGFIKDLSSEDFATREAAFKALGKMGPEKVQ